MREIKSIGRGRHGIPRRWRPFDLTKHAKLVAWPHLCLPSVTLPIVQQSCTEEWGASNSWIALTEINAQAETGRSPNVTLTCMLSIVSKIAGMDSFYAIINISKRNMNNQLEISQFLKLVLNTTYILLISK